MQTKVVEGTISLVAKIKKDPKSRKWALFQSRKSWHISITWKVSHFGVRYLELLSN